MNKETRKSLDDLQAGVVKDGLKGFGVMMLGSLAMGFGIKAMFDGHERMVKASTVSEMIDNVRSFSEEEA